MIASMEGTGAHANDFQQNIGVAGYRLLCDNRPLMQQHNVCLQHELHSLIHFVISSCISASAQSAAATAVNEQLLTYTRHNY